MQLLKHVYDSIPGPSKGCQMDYPALPIGFQTGHLLEGPGMMSTFFGLQLRGGGPFVLILDQRPDAMFLRPGDLD